MKNINIAKNIITLRKEAKITQEQLAQALNVSSQAVSKWETDTCQPDTMTLPLIAEYFHVSIDYLYYGQNISYNDLYEKNLQKVAAHAQMSKDSYEDAHKLFASAHHGISRSNMRGKALMYDEPSHISNENGVSLLSGKGYGAILTKRFFESIDRNTADFAAPLFSLLSDKNRLLICMAIISMSDISYGELKERLHLSDEELRAELNRLIEGKLVVEKQSKHKSLGTTYDIASMYHTCLCILLATAEMQKYSLKGISCYMGYGDYPIPLQ